MIRATNVTTPGISKWISMICSENGLCSSKVKTCNQSRALYVSEYFPRLVSACNRIFFAKERHLNDLRSFSSGQPVKNKIVQYADHRYIKKAQTALFDYLHLTRGIYFTDAEHISKNCRWFIRKILKMVEGEKEIEMALIKYFRYHPFNEFEPFFESIGLKPSEYKPLLPQQLMFLSDAEELLNNFSYLHAYGVAPSKMGKMYQKAKEIFIYESGLLKLKLLAYEQLGLRKATVIKLITSIPDILLGDANEEFALLLKKLEGIGLKQDWIGRHVSEKTTCLWGKMLVLLDFFKDMGFDGEKLGSLLRKHPEFLLCSIEASFSLSCLLLKMRVSRKEICFMLSEFSHIQIEIFTRNLRTTIEFLVEIEMNFEDIKRMICLHKDTLGLIFLKKATSILAETQLGKKRLRKIVSVDPHQLHKYAMGEKVLPLSFSDPDDLTPILEKKKFLSRLGYAENSKEMKMAFEAFHGKREELQDRFDFFVKSGLKSSDVIEMLKKVPNTLNQKIEVLDEKLSFIVHTLGYPLSSVVRFPLCLSYSIERIKLRHLMYEWLKERRKASPDLSLSSLIACSEKMFIKNFVSHHPDGSKAWENFKMTYSSNE